MKQENSKTQIEFTKDSEFTSSKNNTYLETKRNEDKMENKKNAIENQTTNSITTTSEEEMKNEVAVNGNDNSNLTTNNNEETMNSTTSKSANFESNNSQDQFISSELFEFEKVKSSNKQIFANLSKEYETELKKYNECIQKISELKTAIKKRKETVTSEKKDGIIIEFRLTSTQIEIKRVELKEEQFKEKTLKKRRNELASRIKIMTKNIRATYKAKMQNSKKKDEIQKVADKEFYNIKEAAILIIVKYKNTEPEQYRILRNRANINKRSFHNMFMKIFRANIKDDQIKMMVNHTPSIQSRLSNDILDYLQTGTN